MMATGRHHALVRNRVLRLLLACMIAGVALAAAAPVTAAPIDAVETAIARLPVPMHGVAIAWSGEHAYLFGGVTDDGTRLDTVYRYDGSDGSIDRMNARLPSGLSAAGATWADGRAFIVGGFEGDQRGRAIIEYNATLDEVFLVELIPGAAISHPAVLWTGGDVLIFGGDDGTGDHRRIYRYTPTTGELVQTRDGLPTPLWRAAAAWDPDNGIAYLLGGTTPDGPSDAIYRFDPLFDTVGRLDTALPTPRQDAAALWDGDSIIVAGGFNEVALADVLRYDPVADKLLDTGLQLPAPRAAMVGYWDLAAGGTLLGGTNGIDPSDAVYRITGPQHDTDAGAATADSDGSATDGSGDGGAGGAGDDDGGEGDGGSQTGSGQGDSQSNAPPERVFSNATTVEYLTARFSYEIDADDRLLVSFRDASGATDAVNVTQFSWRFGDGQESTRRNPDHRFDRAGIFVVSLTVTDETGLTATTNERLRVGAVEPADEEGIPDTWFIVGTIGLVGTAAALFSFRNRFY